MDQGADQFGQVLEKHRGYLVALGRLHLGRRLWRKMDPEDLAGDTILEALKNRHQFKGSGENELRGWLRTMHLNNFRDALRKYWKELGQQGLEDSLAQSSGRLRDSLEAPTSTPSQKAVRNELLDHLTRALTQLTPEQQQAYFLYREHEMKLAEVAKHLGLSVPATAGLIHRGLKKLKHLLQEEDGL